MTGKRDELFVIERDGVFVLPVLHERLEFADVVRSSFERLTPDAVAVEVPSSLETVWRQAVERLPSISVVVFENAAGETIYLPVHPADALVEAARSAIGRGLPMACADLDVDGYADYRDPLPDSYAAMRLGLPAFYRAFRDSVRPRDPADDRREASMAYHARRLRREGASRVLLLCGMHHAEGVAEALGREQGVPLTRPRRRNVRIVHLHPESLGEVLQEVPFYVAAYEERRAGLPAEPPRREPAAPGRDYGPFRVLSGGRGDRPDRAADALRRAARHAGWGDWQGWRRGDEPSAGADDAGGDTVPGPLDRLKLQWRLLREAEGALAAAAPDERVETWQRRNLARYSRNLARVSGQLVVDLFDLLVAARGCVSENFAYEAHALATAYPRQTESAPGLPTARIRADEMFDGVRRIRLHRRLRRRKREDWHRLLRRRREEGRPGEWIAGLLDGEGLCSYPPEDEIVENFGRYLRSRGKLILSEERSRSVPFTTSVLDGIDVRETIRHKPEGKIYVRELGRVPGGVGSVVVILDEDDDPAGEKFPYTQTWLGEHEQESDMAFYSTAPERGIVGPGICRVTYGGFVLCRPPRRMRDVWTDADYRLAERKSEVLLLAALDYSEERVVVFVGPRPPRPLLHQVAARVDRRILHVPIGTLSPSTLRRIRVMHILSGQQRRSIAKEYIW